MEPDAEQTNYSYGSNKAAFNNEESSGIDATSTQASSPKKDVKKTPVRQLRSQKNRKTASNIAQITPVASVQQKKVLRRPTKTSNDIKKK